MKNNKEKNNGKSLKSVMDEIKKILGKDKITFKDVIEYKNNQEKIIEEEAQKFFKPHLHKLYK